MPDSSLPGDRLRRNLPFTVAHGNDRFVPGHAIPVSLPSDEWQVSVNANSTVYDGCRGENSYTSSGRDSPPKAQSSCPDFGKKLFPSSVVTFQSVMSGRLRIKELDAISPGVLCRIEGLVRSLKQLVYGNAIAVRCSHSNADGDW